MTNTEFDCSSCDNCIEECKQICELQSTITKDEEEELKEGLNFNLNVP